MRIVISTFHHVCKLIGRSFGSIVYHAGSDGIFLQIIKERETEAHEVSLPGHLRTYTQTCSPSLQLETFRRILVLWIAHSESIPDKFTSDMTRTTSSTTDLRSPAQNIETESTPRSILLPLRSPFVVESECNPCYPSQDDVPTDGDAQYESRRQASREMVDRIANALIVLNEESQYHHWKQELQSQSDYMGSVSDGSLRSLFRQRRSGEVVPRTAYQIPKGFTFRQKISSMWKQSMEPDDALTEIPRFGRGLVMLMKESYINLLLIFVPIAISLYYTVKSPALVFTCLYLALLAIGNLIGIFTEDYSNHFKYPVAVFLSYTLGNSVELVSAVVALVQCELRVVQSTLIGVMLSNLLLVLGVCILVGGSKFVEQDVSLEYVQNNSSMLLVVVASIFLPASFFLFVGHSLNLSPQLLDSKTGRSVLSISRAGAICLLILYILHLVFQLLSHVFIMKKMENKSPTYKQQRTLNPESLLEELHSIEMPITPISEAATAVPQDPVNIDFRAVEEDFGPVFCDILRSNQENSRNTTMNQAERPDSEVVKSNTVSSGHVKFRRRYHTPFIIVLVGMTVFLAELLIKTMDVLTKQSALSKEFMSFILLPLLSGNISERVKLVRGSYRDHLDKTVKIIIGSTIQIALAIIPILIITAWIAGKPLSLLFDPLECLALFLAVLTINYTLSDGKTTWLEGAILLLLYVFVVIVFVYYPGFDPEGNIPSC
ncbi:Ca(2+):cation antiporter (CaCA) family protein [Abortiporus biennis]